MRSRVEIAAVCLLLTFYAGLAVSSAWNKSPGVDELSHLTAGVSYWRTGDFRLNSEQGKFPQAWAGLPVACGPFKFPSLDQDAWRNSDEWTLGRQFFFAVGNDAQSMLRHGRAMVTLLGVVLGWVVYLWARRLFGPAGALVSLVAYACSPALLAHGSLTTSDLALTLALTLAVGAGWRVLHRVSAGTVLASAGATALVFVSKASAFVLIPMGLILLVIRLAAGRPLPVCLARPVEVAGHGKQLLVFAAVGLAHAVAVVLVIWACFGFRYSPFRQAEPGRDRYGESWQELLAGTNVATTAISWAREHRVLPDGYLWGVAEARLNAGARRAFLAGQYSLDGWWYFFPFCMAVKTPLWLWGLLGLSLAAGLCVRRAGLPGAAWPEKWPALYDVAPLLVLLLAYASFLLASRLNIGHRHALALYPALLILAGGAGSWLAATASALRAAVGALAMTALVTALWAWPNYLAYFNLAAGGSARGYRLLVDSSSDWGQELPALKRRLDRNPGEAAAPVYLSYFGIGLPDYYGIKARSIPDMGLKGLSGITELKAGTYCISATMLQSVYTRPMGKWCRQYEGDYQAGLKWLKDLPAGSADPDPRVAGDRLRLLEELQFARLAAFLRHRNPDDQVNGSILIYRLTDRQLDEALRGPPAELYDTNQVKR